VVAKMASRAAKPDVAWPRPRPGPGVVVVEPGQELAMLHPLPVSSLWGVGPASAERLQRLGVKTVGDLAAMPLSTAISALGEAAGRQLHELAWARDERPVEPDRPSKSVGHEETYAYDLTDPRAIHREIVRLADLVAARLRESGLAGRTVTIKLRFADFVTVTRSRTFPEALDTGPELARAGAGLLDDILLKGGVRLLGLSASNLTGDHTRQMDLWEEDKSRLSDTWRAVHLVRRRYGWGAVGPATSLEDRRGVDG
jgi:DNA polymerase-4